MKKNRMMRMASVLLVAVLLSTCAISGTFAKYVTAHESFDEARIAYWGFKETTFSITDLFEKTYDNVAGATDVIAPGTTGSAMFCFKPQNATAPEVAYKITVKTDGSACAPGISNNPNIQWKLDDGDWGTFTEMLEAIRELSTETIAAGTFDDAWGATSEHTVSWQWVFKNNDAVTDAQNKQDTALGNKDDLDTVKLVISIVAEQVD